MPWINGGTTRTNTAAHRAARTRVIRRDGTCRIQGPTCTGTPDVVDHITPVAEGGSDDDSNLQAACQPCHDKKTQQEAARGRTSWKRPVKKHPGLR